MPHASLSRVFATSRWRWSDLIRLLGRDAVDVILVARRRALVPPVIESCFHRVQTAQQLTFIALLEWADSVLDVGPGIAHGDWRPVLVDAARRRHVAVQHEVVVEAERADRLR